MQIPFLHQQVILETERLRDMHRSMMMHQSAIPSTEMEAFLQQVRKLYETTLQLSNENALQLLNEIYLANEQRIKHQQIPEAVVEPVKLAEANFPAPVATQNVKQEQVVTEIRSVEVKTETQASGDNVIAEVHQKITHSNSQSVINKSTSQTVANKFTGSSSFADRIAGADSSKRLSDSIKRPVSDINSAIGINEKFQFINHLFHGDSHKYSQFINELNNCPSVDIAKKSIQEISDANQWDGIPVAKHFIDVVERRFSA